MYQWGVARYGRSLLVAGIAVTFLALAFRGAGTRGIIAEEIQPYLPRYPVVLEWARGPATSASIVAMPPYEPGAPPPPRWVATSQWPVVAYAGVVRNWPVFIRGYQSAIATYLGLALGPLLGGGIAGIRRSTALLGVTVVLLAWLFSSRSNPRAAPWAAAIVGLSFGMVSIASTGYGFEVGSRAAMMGSLAVLAARGPPRTRGTVLVGVLAGLAILSRATIAVALVPAMLVLLARRGCRPRGSSIALLLALALGIPVALTLVSGSVAGFRAGTAPLSTLPGLGAAAHLLRAPRRLVLLLAWLGDATSLWGPLARDQPASLGSLAPTAVVASVPVLAGAWRTVRGVAADGEKVFLAALAGSALASAWFYGERAAFQLALPLEPLIALAAGDQLAALGARVGRGRAWSLAAPTLGAAAVAVRLHSLVVGMSLEATNESSMLSGRSQRAAVARMRELGLAGPELVTTSYNHAGVVEAWSDGRLRPLHAWPAFSTAPGTVSDCRLDAAWRILLTARRPRYALLNAREDVYESAGIEAASIDASLQRVLRAFRMSAEVEAFPTEGGTDGWVLVHLVGEPPPPATEEPADLACPRSGAVSVASFHGLDVGERIGGFDIEAIYTAEQSGAVVAWVLARHPSVTAVFDVRPEAVARDPVARGSGFGVSYRGRPSLPDDVLEADAEAIAAVLTP